MIFSFGNRLARDLVEDHQTKATRVFPKELQRAARREISDGAYCQRNYVICAARRETGWKRFEVIEKAFIRFVSINNGELYFDLRRGNAFDVVVEDYH